MSKLVLLIIGLFLSNAFAAGPKCSTHAELQNFLNSRDPINHNQQLDLETGTRFANEVLPLLQSFDQMQKNASGRSNQFGCLIQLSAAGYKWDDGTAVGFAADYLKKEPKTLGKMFNDALGGLNDQCRAVEFAESVKARMCHNKNGNEESIDQQMKCDAYFSAKNKDVFSKCEQSRQGKGAAAQKKSPINTVKLDTAKAAKIAKNTHCPDDIHKTNSPTIFGNIIKSMSPSTPNDAAPSTAGIAQNPAAVPSRAPASEPLDIRPEVQRNSRAPASVPQRRGIRFEPIPELPSEDQAGSAQ